MRSGCNSGNTVRTHANSAGEDVLSGVGNGAEGLKRLDYPVLSGNGPAFADKFLSIRLPAHTGRLFSKLRHQDRGATSEE